MSIDSLEASRLHQYQRILVRFC
ncbi:Protein of unknown function [Pyronema omphalodes CBS 100304]|uniref:Uncharacterized protein n=1 Tax=Pyronema omphalodes (strain CBS 100304) TaxID=1076935 RepID=U4L339_PYROM|nr:Protein of unknown function [Pyronema omphalodes CBS 100304]